MNKKKLGVSIGLASVIMISGVSYTSENLSNIVKESPERYVEPISTVKRNKINSHNIYTSDLEVAKESSYLETLRNSSDIQLDSKDYNKTETTKPVEAKNVDQAVASTNEQDNSNSELSSVSSEKVVSKTENNDTAQVKVEEVKDEVEVDIESSEEAEEATEADNNNDSDIPVVEGNELVASEKDIVAPTVEIDESKIIELPVKGYLTKNLNVRSSGRIGDNIIGLLPVGTEVSGIESNGWIKIDYKGSPAYISYEYLSNSKVVVEEQKEEPKDKPQEEKQEEPKQEPKQEPKEETKPVVTTENVKGWITSNLNLRQGKGTDTKILTVLPKGTAVSGTLDNGWVKITYKNYTGYIARSFISDKEVKVEAPKPVESPKTEDNNQTATGSAALDKIVNGAYGYLGYRYVYASANPNVGFDCSGLVYYLYKTHAGVTLNRSSRDQASNGYAVSRNNLKAGDLLFFATSGGSRISHVGIYVGGGKMIHASTPGTGVILTDINTSYYVNNYVTARRILD
ncbi:C40 family peptidase [Lagierella sp.]|uniref:C40 family peptidase n=1 Tax=Lagierella sp. TaxID=2849657 RepID=UPI002610B2C3|nr:C40 family peptidase [Lagierella sp.]